VATIPNKGIIINPAGTTVKKTVGSVRKLVIKTYNFEGN